MSSKKLVSVQFSSSVMSDSLRLHELQHTRPPYPSPTPRVYSNSCPLSQWCHPISSSVVPFSSCLQSFPASGSQFFASGGHWSFSISPSNEHSGLISFRVDWFDLLAVQGTLKSSPTPQFKSINSLVLSFSHPYKTSGKKHSFELNGLLSERAYLVAQLVKNLPVMRETWVWSLGWEDPLEKETATHSSILAWRSPQTVWSMGSKRVRGDRATFTFREGLNSLLT